MYFLIDFIRETLDVFCRTAPFLLFGFFLAGVLKVLIPPRWLAATLGKNNFRSVFLASLAGVPLPLCSCSVLPTAVAMRQSGASKGATTSFLVSTPETGIDSISVTYALMDPIMTVARPLAAFGTALAAGTAVNLVSRDNSASTPTPDGNAEGEPSAGTEPEIRCSEPTSETCHQTPNLIQEEQPAVKGRLRQILFYGYGQLLDSIAPWFLIGIALTGLITAVIPAGALANPAIAGFPSMLAMLLIGIPLYVCATASTPIAAALIMKGLSPGAALVFLLAGPATNATGLTVLLKILGKWATVVYLAAIAVMSLIAGAIVNSIYVSSGIDAVAIAGQGGRLIPTWIEIPAALVLLALFIRSASRIDLLNVWREGLGRIGRPLGLNLGGRAALRVYAAIFMGLYLLTAFSTVGPGEIGWVVTFGEITRTVDEPGLVMHWPYPISFLEKERPTLVRSVDRGFRPDQDVVFTYDRVGTSMSERELTKEAEIATGDENLLSLRYSVQYSVSEAYTFHFEVNDPDQLVSSFSEYAVRRVMSEQETDSILVNHRIELEFLVAERLRSELDLVGAGVSILRVDLVDVHAPAEVHFAFRDVASAMEDKHRFAMQAESYRNRVVAAARGKAYTTTVGAEREKMMQVAEAQGRACGFTALEEACRDSREITRLRFYLDAATKLLPNARVILPLADLPLDLWVNRSPGTQSWPEPFGRSSDTYPASPAAGADEGTALGTGADDRFKDTTTRKPGETWRDKLNRLQETKR